MTNFISPESFPFFQSILFLLVVMIGGSGTVLGPLIGAVVVVLLPEFLSFLAEYRLLFVGALLLVVLWLAPEGVAGAIGRFTARPEARAARPGGSTPRPSSPRDGAARRSASKTCGSPSAAWRRSPGSGSPPGRGK